MESLTAHSVMDSTFWISRGEENVATLTGRHVLGVINAQTVGIIDDQKPSVTIAGTFAGKP